MTCLYHVTWFHPSLERSSSLGCEGNWTRRDTGADASTYVSLAGSDSLSRPLSPHPPVQRKSCAAMHFEMCRVTKDQCSCSLQIRDMKAGFGRVAPGVTSTSATPELGTAQTVQWEWA